VVTFVLGCAAGGIAAVPFARWARRETVVTRVRPRRDRKSRSRRALPPPLASIGRVLRSLVARRATRRDDAALRAELPVVVDLVAVALGAGCTPFLAIEHASRHAPGRTAAALRGVTRAQTLGQSLDDALLALGRAHRALRPLVDALRTSARLGSPATLVLERLAADVRADVRRRAEARARTVPVRLCFPLVACVLPAFALLTVAPVVLGGLHT
jgi:Flp pilus assembly protein TadB